MNLSGLFETQAALDARIFESHPELKGQDNLDWKVLALQVELGECANEWRGFKKWSNDQEPRVRKACTFCNGSGLINFIDYSKACRRCNGSGTVGNPLLEEYVDCLHFILSIGLEKGFEKQEFPYLHDFNVGVYTDKEALTQFSNIFHAINEFSIDEDIELYEELFLHFIGLGKLLGFTWEQIEAAYFDKNKINHQRQESGY